MAPANPQRIPDILKLPFLILINPDTAKKITRDSMWNFFNRNKNVTEIIANAVKNNICKVSKLCELEIRYIDKIKRIIEIEFKSQAPSRISSFDRGLNNITVSGVSAVYAIYLDQPSNASTSWLIGL